MAFTFLATDYADNTDKDQCYPCHPWLIYRSV